MSSPPLMTDLSRGLVWKSRLHERLKMHLWRIAANVLPTKDAISQFANVEVECPLCNLSDESSLHIFALCPIAKSLWFRSQWGVKTDLLGLSSIQDFINFLFSPPFAEEHLRYKEKISYCLEQFYVMLSGDREIFLFLKMLMLCNMAPHSLAKWSLACNFFSSFDLGNNPPSFVSVVQKEAVLPV
ncbi:hypothetical protein SO802_028767 [Lithocarpus litseifolius]|uniref:Reverse transcriptase zinc-binding domain-containing protein n=1 Tax=Lithocarpus litseifolius TaxID=425828 RepID=A0AAW2BSQ8_9ROSI